MSHSDNDRQFFVVDEYHRIPIGELRPIVGGTATWIKCILNRYVGSKPHPIYVVELMRMTKTKHVPKRMHKHFEALRKKLDDLGFLPNFEATIPAIGPYVSAILGMSRRDGDIHFLSRRVTRKAGRDVVDENDFRFVSNLPDGRLLVTSTKNHLPRPREGLDAVSVDTSDPSVLLKKHRERIRRLTIQNISPNDMYARLLAENEEFVEDLLERKIVRLATSAEVTRIRTESRL